MDNIPLGSSTPPPVFSTPPPVSIPPIQPETPKRGISWKIIAGILAVLVLIAVLALNYFNILPWKNYTSKSGTSIGKSQAVSSPSPLPAASTNATTVFSNYIKSVLKPVYQGQGDLDIKILTLPDKDYDTYTSTKYFDNAIIVANYSVGKGGQFAKDVPIEINVLVFETTGKDSKDLTSQSISSMMNEYFNIPAGLTPDSWKKSTAGGNTVYEIVQDNANTTKDTRTAWLAAWKYIDKDGKIVGGTYQLRACLIFPASPGYKGGTCTAGF